MKKAFTLLEILISLGILTVGVIGVITLFPFGLKVQNSAKMESCASRLAQEKMEEAIFNSYDQAVSESEDYGEIADFPLYKRMVTVDYYDPDVSATSSQDTGIKKVEVRVSWESPIRFFQKDVVFETLISENK